MSDKSKIEWTDATWNPVTGCTKVSEGCRNCYALTFAERWRGTPGHYFEKGFDIVLRPDKLDEPLKWKRPRRIFVNSMSDLFHPEVPFDFIEQVYATMALAKQHTFQILTKRPGRMMDFYNRCVFNGHFPGNEPLKNVWIGVSVENQKAADERIPLLLQTPAAVRFLSMEPLLGGVDLSPWLGISRFETGTPWARDTGTDIDWIIVGGESGRGARPMHPDWTRSLRDQCQSAGVPFFFKQWGEWLPVHPDRKTYEYSSPDGKCTEIDGMRFYRIGKKFAGRLLDGRTWDEMPDCLEMDL